MFQKLNKFSIKLSGYCDMGCIYCHQLSQDKNSNQKFSLYIELIDFLKKCKFSHNTTEVTLTGGEITLSIKEFFKAFRFLENNSDKLGTVIHPIILSGGSKFIEIIKLLKNKIIKPCDVGLSWDGIHSYTKSRKSNNNKYNDDHFNRNIKMIGDNGYGRDLSIMIAITPYTIDDLYDSVIFALENKVYNFTFYYIHEGNYNDSIFVNKFRNQLRKIAMIFIKTYHTKDQFEYYNWKNIYSRYSLKDKDDFLSQISCKKLGNSVHFDTDGGIYPCIYFADHKAFQIGHLLDGGVYPERVEQFQNEFLEYPNCNWRTCGNRKCFECPASNFVHNGKMKNKFMNICNLVSIEKEVFDEFFPMLDIACNEYKNYWFEDDAEFFNHLEEKRRTTSTLPEAKSRNYIIPLTTGIISENARGVLSWG